MNSQEFHEGLIASGLLYDGGALGLVHRSSSFEKVVRSIEAYVSAAGTDEGAPKMYLSSLVPVATLVGSGYVKSFPNLLGTINSFGGGDSDLAELHRRLAERDEWQGLLTPTNLGLASAACHPLYPLLADAAIPTSGLKFEVHASCFRHEPSPEPARLQSFRMHEFVYVGTADGALEHRDRWLGRAHELLADLGIPIDRVEANDPFFGRAGRLLAAGQVEKNLKFELVAPLSGPSPNAVGSGNYHEDHFAVAYNLRLEDGSLAHSACFGFGLERIALALYFAHGFDEASWPSEVGERLALGRNSAPGSST